MENTSQAWFYGPCTNLGKLYVQHEVEDLDLSSWLHHSCTVAEMWVSLSKACDNVSDTDIFLCVKTIYSLWDGGCLGRVCPSPDRYVK